LTNACLLLLLLLELERVLKNLPLEY